jgi:tetratricopeptide (TPR) repeat protein
MPRPRLPLLALGLLALLSLACASLRAPLTPPARGGAAWTEVTSTHFVLRTDAEPAAARELIARFEGYHAALAQALSVTAGSTARIELIRFERARDLAAISDKAVEARARFTTQWPGDLEPRPTLLFHGQEMEDVARETFLHELTHRFVQQRYAAVPLWLNEGLAQYHETMRIEEGRLVLGDVGPTDFWEQSFATTTWRGNMHTVQIPVFRALTVWKLIDADRAAFYAGQTALRLGKESSEAWSRESAAYVSAWKLVHYLLNGPNAADRDRFQVFLGAVERGARARDAFLETFGSDLPRLEASFRSYLLQVGNGRRVIPYPAAPPPAAVTARPMSEAEVHLLWGMLLPAEKGAADAARRQLDEALALDPGSPEVRYARAVFFLRQEQWAEADREIEAALAARPDEPRFLFAQVTGHLWRTGDALPLAQRVPAALDEHLARTATSARQLAQAGLDAGVRGRVDEGLRLVGRSVAADPLCWWCQVARARLLVADRKLDEAAAAAERALTLLPEKADPGGVLETRREIEKARAAGPR